MVGRKTTINTLQHKYSGGIRTKYFQASSIFIILALAAHYSKPDQGALRKWKIAGDVFFAVIGNSN